MFANPKASPIARYRLRTEHGDAEQSDAAEEAEDQTHHGPRRVDLQSNQICGDVVPLNSLNGGMPPPTMQIPPTPHV
jgi:hypothetical protein